MTLKKKKKKKKESQPLSIKVAFPVPSEAMVLRVTLCQEEKNFLNSPKTPFMIEKLGEVWFEFYNKPQGKKT